MNKVCGRYKKVIIFTLTAFVIASLSLVSVAYYQRDKLLIFVQNQLNKTVQSYFSEAKIEVSFEKIKWGGVSHPFGIKINNFYLQANDEIAFESKTVFLSPDIMSLLTGKIAASVFHISQSQLSHNHQKIISADMKIVNASSGYDITIANVETTAEAAVSLMPLDETFSKDKFAADIPLSGGARLLLNQAGISGKINFHLEKGSFKLAPYYPHNMSIDQGNIEIDITPDRIHFTNISLTHNKTTLTASAIARASKSLMLLLTQGARIDCQVDGVVTDAPIDEINLLWPYLLAPLPREWVTENLSHGHVSQATLHSDISILFAAPGKVESVNVNELNGIIDAHNVNVNYFGKLPSVENVEGHCAYTKHQFVINTHGVVNGVELQRGYIIIHDLDKKDTYFQLEADLVGPLQNCLQVIEKPPLKLASKIGLNVDSLSGSAVTQLNLMFLLEPGIDLEDINVKARSTIIGGAIKTDSPMFGYDVVLEEGRFDVTIDNSKLGLHGEAKVFGQPSRVSWTEYFKDHNIPYRRHFDINSDVNIKPKATGGIVSGHGRLSCAYTVALDNMVAIATTSDLTGMEIDLPWLSYYKSATQPLQVVVHKEATSSHTLRITGHDLDIIAMSKPGQLLPLDVNIKKFGDLSGQLKVNYDKQQLYLDGSLDVIDVRLFKDLFIDLQQPSTPLPDFDLYTDIKVNKLIYSDQLSLSKLTSKAHYLNGHFVMVDILSDLERFSFMLSPPHDNRQTFILTAADGGDIIEAFAPGYDFKGGKLQIVGERVTRNDTSEISGEIDLKEITFVKAPLLAKILSLTSLDGFVKTMAGEGIYFDHAYATFNWGKKEIAINNLHFYGTALGLEAEGALNILTNTLSFKGDVIPFYSVNHFLTKIPVLGPLLTGTDKKGMFGAAFKIAGDLSNPQLSVSPLTTIAPTGLRQLANTAADSKVAAPWSLAGSVVKSELR